MIGVWTGQADGVDVRLAGSAEEIVTIRTDGRLVVDTVRSLAQHLAAVAEAGTPHCLRALYLRQGQYLIPADLVATPEVDDQRRSIPDSYTMHLMVGYQLDPDGPPRTMATVAHATYQVPAFPGAFDRVVLGLKERAQT